MSADKPPKGAKPPKGSSLSGPHVSLSKGQGASGHRTSSAGPKRPLDGPPPGQPDVGEIARAVSTGFMTIVIGGLTQPVVATLVPFLGVIWLILTAVLAFAYTGFKCGAAGPNPPLYGAGGAVGAYALVVPLLFVVGTFEPLTALSSLVAGAVIGGVAGYVGGRRRPVV